MEFIEKFAGAGSFGDSLISGSGDDVGLTVEDIFLYTLLPFGQLIMRIYKYGGSLDKPYLLLLMFPSFGFLVNFLNPYDADFGSNMLKWSVLGVVIGWIAPLMGYYKLINKVEDADNLDAAFFIPIFVRLLLVLGFMYFQFETTFMPYIINLVLFGILMLTNFIHLALRKQCNSNNNKDVGSRFVKVLIDTIFQYGIIFFFMGMFTKTKHFASDLYDVEIPLFQNVGIMVESITWSFGAMFGYITTNMIDSSYGTDNKSPYKNDDVCKGDISALRHVTSVLVLLGGLIYYVREHAKYR
jgi:hypothetical protein